MKKCEYCGKLYTVKHPSQRFCSHKGPGNCKDRWHNRNEPTRLLGARAEYVKTEDCEDPGDDMYWADKDW